MNLPAIHLRYRLFCSILEYFLDPDSPENDELIDPSGKDPVAG
jgi:hypothetical protein